MTKFLLVFTLVAACLVSNSSSFTLSFGDFSDYVKNLNYPVESHDITTEDGYILTYFRIQAKNQQKIVSGLPVLFLQHGFIDSADTFVVNTEADAPGLQLANLGYDVWFGNSRGNKYCKSHVSLNSSDAAFWQFTWQNMSQYDLPAAFQYINQQTGQNITYIGHSQGTSLMFAALSERDPTILQYLKKFIALAPVAWVTHIQSGPFRYLADSNLAEIMVALKINQFFPPDFMENEFGHVFCGLYPNVCGNFLKDIAGADPQYDNYDDYDIILEHEPAGSSVMDALHWKQEVLTASFDKYDFGTQGNLLHYNQTTPPAYNISNINFPISMFVGSDDIIASAIDTQSLIGNLTGCPHLEYKEYPAGHMTWLWSKNISFYFGDLVAILDDSIIQ